MSQPLEIPVPRHDFYQTPAQVTVSLYIKGYAGLDVLVNYHTSSVEVILPPRGEDPSQSFTLTPLAGHIAPGECTERVLGTKIELKLAKDEPVNWPTLVGTGAPITLSAVPLTSTPTAGSSSSAPAAARPAKKNWDKLAATLDDDDSETPAKDSADPNAGGDAALQKLFAGIYANADEDTKRAMIKSFTESGGTSLSTDWSSVGSNTTPVRPPDGMYEMKM